MREVSNGTGLREHVLLFSRFLRSPRTVGALDAKLARRRRGDGRARGLRASRDASSSSGPAPVR